MKKQLLTTLIISTIFGATAQAKDNSVYIGLNYQNGKLKNSWSHTEADQDGAVEAKVSPSDRTSGFSVNFGKSFAIHQNFSVAVEAEYLRFRGMDVSWEIKDPVIKFETYDEGTGSVNVSGYTLSAKPKYYFGDSGFSLGPILGIGLYERNDDEEIGFNYGLEIAYIISDKLSMNSGYKVHNADFDMPDGLSDYDMKMDSFYAGLQYRF